MKKINKKGFVLLETLLVSTFIITILVYLYVQFVNLKNGYESSFNYDSVPNIYSLKQADRFINKEYGYGDLKEDLSKSTSHYIELFNNSCDLQYFSNNYSYCNKLMNDLNIKTLLMLDNRIDTIKENFSEHNPYTNGLFNYLKKIDPVLASQSYLLVAEFKDNSYAYLKLDDVNVVVTFDANGGTVSTQTKNVIPGTTYGQLPTPTRNGYTFKGWNGKNKFDQEKLFMAVNGATKDGEYYVFGPNYAYALYQNGFPNIAVKENIKYTFSFTGYQDGTSNYAASCIGFRHGSGGNGSIYTCIAGTEEKSYKITSDNPYTKPYLTYGTGTYTNHIKNVQLEEGEEATEYEPYYITSNTKVTQSTDHTLTAIWEANS